MELRVMTLKLKKMCFFLDFGLVTLVGIQYRLVGKCITWQERCTLRDEQSCFFVWDDCVF